MDDQQCPFCNQPILQGQASVTLTLKGCAGISKASDAKGTELRVVPGQKVHTECRKGYCSQNSIDSFNRKKRTGSPCAVSQALRSVDMPFDYKSHCLFCGTEDIYGGKRKDFTLVPVRTFDFQIKVLETCKNRDDDWGTRVKIRIEFVPDLPAADAVYHQACSVNFRTNKRVPQKYISDDVATKRAKLGRPQDSTQTEAFVKAITHLEDNDDEQITVNDLIQKMEENLAGTDAKPYSFTHMKEQIKKHFGNKILITEVNGKSNVVTLWSTASTILHDFYDHPKHESPDLEKTRILETAANLIKSDMKSLVQPRDLYPEYNELTSIEDAVSFLPESLRIFRKSIFTSSDALMKTASIGQAMIQSTRPRVILTPLQLGLGVQLHHHFGSKFLIDTLHKHGFCCSYAEVTKYERSAAVCQGTEIPNATEETFVQYVADNVDHNIRTIDGHNTFHGMGIIAAVTPILTDKEAAPTELLEMVRCNCKMGCSTRQCTCRKHDLECSTACGQCRGVCSNVESVLEEDDDLGCDAADDMRDD